jgi:Matrixin
VDTARPLPSAGARRTSNVITVLLAVLLIALFVVAAVAAATPGHGSWSQAGDRIHPALPADLATAPLARPAAAPGGTGGYRFLELEDNGSGRPVRWDPCRPIHYVIRPDGAPPGGQLAIEQAIARMEQVTGLRFSSDGTTGEAPRPNRPAMDQGRYGNRWSPVLIAWTDPAEYPGMTGYAGLGGPDTVAGSAAGSRRYVSGVILLNRDHLASVARWNAGQDRLDAVVLHEFGHLIGLDHVTDPAQLMYRQPSPHAGGFGDGDRRGLALLSDGPCFRDF